MAKQDRDRWEERHRTASELSARESIRTLLRAPSTGAVALDLASGQGRHSLALRGAGYRVIATDVSMSGLRHAQTKIDSNNEAFLAVQGDVDDWCFANGVFDLVLQVDFLDRSLFPHVRSSLRRGGLLLIETFLDQGRRNLEGPSRPEFLLRPDELPTAFPEFEVLHYSEHRGESARATFLGRKP